MAPLRELPKIPLDLVVCAGAVMGVLALISSNTESGLTTASITERPGPTGKSV